MKFKDLDKHIELSTPHYDPCETDIGAVTIRCEGREYILDVGKTEIVDEDGMYNIYCHLFYDPDTFADCKYDLLVEDLINPNITLELWTNMEDITITFYAVIDKLTIALQVKNE